MENKERMSGFGYILFNFIAAIAFYVLGLVFYAAEFARGTFDYGPKYIIAVIATFTILFIAFCIVNGKKCRSIFGVLINVAAPISILNVGVLVKRAGDVGFWCAAISLVVVVFFGAFVWLEDKTPIRLFFEKLKISLIGEDSETCEEAKNNELCEQTEYELTPSKCIYSSVIAFFIALCVISTLAIGWLGIFQTHYNSYYNSDVSYNEKYIPNADMSEYVKIESKTWNTLNIDSRLEILQKIAEQEAVRLGLPEVPTVVTTELYNNVYDVNYNSEENIIELDLDMVKYSKNGYKAVKALANGTYRAYENAKKQLVEAINSDEETSKYSGLVMFWDTNINKQFAFEENAAKYSKFVQSEYRRKIMLFKFDGNKDHY